MRRILVITGKTVGILMFLFIFLLLLSFINHRIQLSKEEDRIAAMGNEVEVGGHLMHVYSEGEEGDQSLVFMSGGGTSSPVLDFKSLYSKLSDEYKTIVVEKKGYGNSEVADVPRDIDSILSDTRKALRLAGHQPPYVLVPHSMSGLEALYWAQNYPDEVEMIIGLDMAVPEAYSQLSINLPLVYLAKFAADTGITRFIPKIAESDAMKYGKLSEDEKEMVKAIFFRRTSTTPMVNEIKSVQVNATKVEEKEVPDIPILILASNGEETGLDPENWQDILSDFVSEAPNGEMIVFNVPHYLHNHEYQEISKEIRKFLENK